MKIPPEIIKKAWVKSDGRCQCRGECGSHPGPCQKELTFSSQGKENSWGCWEMLVPETPENISMKKHDYKVMCRRCYSRIYEKNKNNKN